MTASKPLWKIYSFDDIASTMDTARALLLENMQGRYAVISARQTQGRGRHQRVWSSPLGNLYTTFVIPLKKVSEAPFFSYISALAAREALVFFAQDAVNVTLKWPNDLLLASKKGGGILLELEQRPQGSFLLIGMGINLVSHPKDTPYPATNLQDYDISVTPEKLLTKILDVFDFWQGVFEKEGFEPVRQAWLTHRDPAHSHMMLKGYEHGVQSSIRGVFHGLDEKGCLILDVDHGKGTRVLRKFSAGDVFFL